MTFVRIYREICNESRKFRKAPKKPLDRKNDILRNKRVYPNPKDFYKEFEIAHIYKCWITYHPVVSSSQVHPT